HRSLFTGVVPRTRKEGNDWKVLEQDLREHLRCQLPSFMLPAALVPLESLPLTPSGKLDRSALPTPDREWHAADSFVAPRTATERRLAQLWGEVLGLEAVGANDDFFE